MSYASILEDLPQELQLPLVKFGQALEEKLHADLAVRRQDFDRLTAVVAELVEAQKRTGQSLAELAEAQRRTDHRFDELAAAQQRTEQRVGELAAAQQRTEQRVGELAAAQQRTEQRVTRIEIALAELAEAQKVTEQRVSELTAAVKALQEAVTALIARLDRTDDRLVGLIGDNLERKYRERAFSYFGQILRRVEVMSLQDVIENLESQLSDEEFNDLLLLDVLLRGRVRGRTPAVEVVLAVEVSSVVDRNDVVRAIRRAGILRKAGLAAIAVAAGEDITTGGYELAREEDVLVLRDGQRLFWDEALSTLSA